MAVYVDKAFIPYGRMVMCHMVADTLEELHTMAQKIGVRRKWFQNHNPRRPHYDICQSKRDLALKYGAIEVDPKALVEILKRIEHDRP